MEEIKITNEDNMDLMARYDDNHFDLAIVDPPYGIDAANEKKMQSRHHSQKKYKGFNDLETPKLEYFLELKRVSKNQIIWGGNYFISKIKKDSSCWIFWDKDGYGDFADGELAWTSFKTAVRKIKYTWNGFRRGNYNSLDKKRIHPTEKPCSLYEWLLKNYAKEGDKILDTHLGSGSIAIAIHRMNQIEKMNLTLTACELDRDYYNDAIKRIEQQTSQKTIFDEH